MSEQPSVGVQAHEHRDCSPERREWLEADEGHPATARKHAHCAECGTVRYMGRDRARGVGYYQNLLADLGRFLVHDRLYAKLPQVHVRLISTELERMQEFHDTYDLKKSLQVDYFVDTVRKFRPDLPSRFLRDFIEHGPPQPGVPDSP